MFTRRTLALLLLTILLAGCLPPWGKYRPSREGMPEALRTQLETQLDRGAEQLAQTTTEADKADPLFEMAFAEEQLGRYDKAIPHYEQVLAIQPNHFQSLNNLGVIHEELGELEKSVQYYGKLLNANPDSSEALTDSIRVLLALDHTEDAQKTLENFAKSNKGEKYTQLISEQFELIRAASAK